MRIANTATCLFLLAAGLLIGCQSHDSVAETGSNAPSLEPADLEKLTSWDATSKASARLTEKLADIMASVKDEETAAAAIPQLRQLAPKFAAVSRAEKAFGEPTKADQSLVLSNLAAAHQKFDKSYVPLMENEALKAIVGQAIDDAYVGNVTE